MKIIDGKKISEEIIKNLKKEVKNIEPPKFFGALLVGNNKASLNFLNKKKEIAKELGIDFRIYNLDENITTDKLRDEIQKIAKHKTCGGFTVQLPLPSHINTHYVLNAIPKEKDLDLLSEHSLGAFYTDRSKILPPAVEVIKEIISRENIELKNLNVAVIGFGFLVGKPISFWLLPQVKNLKVFNSKSFSQELLKDFDLIIAGVGKAGLFSAKHLKNDAVVVDFGYDFKDNKIKGDFDDSEVLNTNILYTPTPGGTGPILVAKLFENFIKLNNLKKS